MIQTVGKINIIMLCKYFSFYLLHTDTETEDGRCGRTYYCLMVLAQRKEIHIIFKVYTFIFWEFGMLRLYFRANDHMYPNTTSVSYSKSLCTGVQHSNIIRGDGVGRFYITAKRLKQKNIFST